MSALDFHPVLEHGAGMLGALWRVTWQGALFTLAVWALTRALPRLPAAVRTTLWWLVGLKCLVSLCAPVALPLPLLPAAESPRVSGARATAAPALEPARAAPSEPPARAVPSVHAPETHGSHLGVQALWAGALLLWLGGLVWQGRELFRDLARLRHLRREARPLEDTALRQAAETLGRALGLTRAPRLLVSDQAPSPLALGPLRPEIILPRRALETLSPLEQRMALAHELAHVRRGDLWLGWVPALARAVFFFHPLVLRACREYALAREEACDAAALQATGAAPRDYGRLLLVFGVARAPAAAAASGASPHLAALKRRIAMLDHVGSESKQRRWAPWALGGLALVALVPIQVVARETNASPPAAAPQAALAAPAAPARPAAPALVPDTIVPAVKAPAAPARIAAVRPVVPTPPTPPTPRAPPEPTAHMDPEDSRYAYVLLQDSDSVSMSGSAQDVKVARHLAGNTKAPLLYARREDGQEFLIRDASTLRAFEDAFKPVKELGKQQGELGAKQGEFGAKMGELGAKMGEFGSQQGKLGRKQAQLSLKKSLLDLEDEEETPDTKRQRGELEREQKELEAQLEALEKQMEPLHAQMEALGAQMEKYQEPMEALGAQMEAIGERMEVASREATKKAEGLLDDAIRKGLAEPVKR